MLNLFDPYYLFRNCLKNKSNCLASTYCTKIDCCINDFLKKNITKSQLNKISNKFYEKFIKEHSDTCQCLVCKDHDKLFNSFLQYAKDYKTKIRFFKTPIYSIIHPVYGEITTFIHPGGFSKDNRRNLRVLMRDGCCQNCKSLNFLTIDHIQDLSKGGPRRSMKNLQVLCETCNQNKSNPSKK